LATYGLVPFVPAPYIAAGDDIEYAAVTMFELPFCEQVAERVRLNVANVNTATPTDSMLLTPPDAAITAIVYPLVGGALLNTPE
jgi:hypothetical protein